MGSRGGKARANEELERLREGRLERNIVERVFLVSILLNDTTSSFRRNRINRH